MFKHKPVDETVLLKVIQNTSRMGRWLVNQDANILIPMPLCCTTIFWPTFGFSFLLKEITTVEHRTFKKILLRRFQSKTVTYTPNLQLHMEQFPLEKKKKNLKTG